MEAQFHLMNLNYSVFDMENIELIVGKRYLIEDRVGFNKDIFECAVVEFSPSNKYMKIRWVNGIENWVVVKQFYNQYTVIEQLT